MDGKRHRGETEGRDIRETEGKRQKRDGGRDRGEIQRSRDGGKETEGTDLKERTEGNM